MELTLTQTGNEQQVAVGVNGRFSHHFDLFDLAPNDQNPDGPPQPLEDPQAFGEAVFEALFPEGSAAAETLAERPERIVLLAVDRNVQNVPWEYAHSASGGYLVCRFPFVRGLPQEQRRPVPDLSEIPLHITAVPSDPLHPDLPPLAIEAEWLRLAQVVDDAGSGITLERVRPPTVEQLRRQVAGHSQRIIHFMGHGGQLQEGAVLLFEQTDGGLEPVAAQDFVDRVGDNAFLVTLNACVSATPGATLFDNLARTLVERHVPYALGMRFSIGDDDARLFSRAFYGELAAGEAVEKALRQARIDLAGKGREYAVGVPVLYTSLFEEAGRFRRGQGEAFIDDKRRGTVQLQALPRIDGLFHGRAPELQAIGARLTADTPPRLLTVHGVGGQGKTAVARQAAERFSFAFRAGVYAANLEALPSSEEFVAGLARFLEINPDDYAGSAELQGEVSKRLQLRRLLLVLDNAETLLQAVEREEEGPRALMQYIRQQLSLPTVTMLVTSRRWTDWPHEERLELDGLSPKDGADLFYANTPNRQESYSMDQARELSEKLEGHPLSLRLLAAAYNAAAPLAFEPFVEGYEERLLAAEDLLQDPRHRHRSLAAAIQTSVDFLPGEARDLLSGLWVWHGPFLPEAAVALFDPDSEEPEKSEIPRSLTLLHRRGLLVAERPTFGGGSKTLFRLLPSLRPYIAQLTQATEKETLLARFGQVQAAQLRFIFDNMKKGGLPVYLAQQGMEDLERGLDYIEGETAVAYLRRLGWVVQHLGNRERGMALLESARNKARGNYPELYNLTLNDMAGVYHATGRPAEALALYEEALNLDRAEENRGNEAATLNNMAAVYYATGRPAEALATYEAALPIRREVGDRAGEAATLNNMGMVYQATGRPAEALRLYEAALPIRREVGDRAGEAATLNNMAGVYQATGRPAEALRLYEEVLTMVREVGQRAWEAVSLWNVAHLLLQMDRKAEAIVRVTEAIAIFRGGLTHDSSGDTVEGYENLLQKLQSGELASSPDQETTGDGLMQALIAFINTENWSASRQVLEAQQELLLSEESDEAIVLLLEQARGTQETRTVEVLELHRHLLRRCREVGIEAAFTELEQERQSDGPDALQQALVSFVNAGDLAAKRRLLEADSVLLLTEEAGQRLAEQAAEFEQSDNGQLAETLRFHQALLERCRELGIDGAFGELQQMQDNVLPIPRDLPGKAVEALRGDNAQKLQVAQQAASLSAATDDAALKAFYSALQNAIFGADLTAAGANLEEPYAQIWGAIVEAVENE